MSTISSYFTGLRSSVSLVYSTRMATFFLFAFILLLSHLPTRVRGVCPGQQGHVACNGHGICGDYDRCICFRGYDGTPLYTGYDCTDLICPKAPAWVSDVAVSANNVHPVVECSNRGTCFRKTGACQCYPGYEGLACERTVCPMDCSGNGVCFTQRELAEEAQRVYVTPWDANKMTGCVCDLGFRGVDCSRVECPSGPDPLKVMSFPIPFSFSSTCM